MTNTEVEVGALRSGDVNLRYRKVGLPGRVPLLILHGGNYYDSLDWLPIASGLALDREVVAYDQRGMGESDWSPSKNYSDDAIFGDVLALMDHFGWQEAAILGQSRNAMRAVAFAAYFPGHVAGVIMADSVPGSGPPPSAGAHQPVGLGPKVYPSLEAVQESMSNDRTATPGSAAYARLLRITKPVEGGFIVATRDPDMDSAAPIDQPGWQSRFPSRDPWEVMSEVAAPVLVLQAARSKSCKPESLYRLEREFPNVTIERLDSGHDLPVGAPYSVIDTVGHFLRTRVD